MEYTEVARSETERGELVLRQGTREDGGPRVLELRANDALERRRLETKTTRSRRRNVIEITATWIPWKILCCAAFR